MKNKSRNGELIIIPCQEIKGKKLNHLILAEGEVTGHKHEVIGDAKLYEDNGVLYLSVNDTATIVHPDHKPHTLPKGNYKIQPQREYVVGDEKYRRVSD